MHRRNSLEISGIATDDGLQTPYPTLMYVHYGHKAKAYLKCP